MSHNSPVVAALWMDGDEGVIDLSEDGLVSKWTRDVSASVDFLSIYFIPCQGPESMEMGENGSRR